MVKKNDFSPSVNEKGYVAYDGEGTRRPYRRSKYTDIQPSFESDAMVELEMMTKSASGSSANVRSAYRTSVYSFICKDEAEHMRISLIAQDYVCSEFKLKITQAVAVGVFAKVADSWELLWKAGRLAECKNPIYLNLSYIKKKLGKVFSSVEITLGLITFGRFQAIAWCVSTEQGKFYIPWHNGAFVPESPMITFEERELEEMKKTYNLLRISKDYNPHDVCYKFL